jgi:glycerate-2-kinase
MTAAHPDPDERSERAGRRALALAATVPSGGTLLVLLSGGASALLCVPAPGLTVADKAAAARALMADGVSIAELNAVRKHLSDVKGGRLGAAAGWRVRTLAISDVHGPVADDPSVIGSGPTVPDTTTFADALAVVQRSRAEIPAAVRRHLEAGAKGLRVETPKDTGGAPADVEVIGNRRTAMAGAAAAAAALGYEVQLVEAASSGEARVAGRVFAERALAAGGGRPVCVIGAGEPVVTVSGDGRGGRNQEFVLGAAPVLHAAGEAGMRALCASAGTDGTDGPTDAAGAIVTTASVRRARASGLDIDAALARNDAYPLLAALGDLLTWGPTGTNVGDLHVLLRAG